MSTHGEDRDEELGAAINDVAGPGHAPAFWSDVSQRLDGGSTPRGASSGRRRWVAAGLLVAAAIVAIAMVNTGGGETTEVSPAVPTTDDPAQTGPDASTTSAPAAAPSMSTTTVPAAVGDHFATGTGAGVVDDQVLVFAVDPDTELDDCQGIGPARELQVLTADGVVVETVPGATEYVRYADGPDGLLAGFTSCEGYPRRLWAEDDGGDVLDVDLIESGVGQPLDLAWRDAETLLVVGHLGYEDIAAPYVTRLFSVDVETAAVTDLGDEGIRQIEVLADGSLVRGYEDRVEFGDRTTLGAEGLRSVAAAADGSALALIDQTGDLPPLRLLRFGGTGRSYYELLDPDAYEVVGFSADGSTLYYNATTGDGTGVVRGLDVWGRPDSIGPEFCSAGTLASATHVVGEPYSELVARIQAAARACDPEALAELAGEITYSFGGGDDFGGHLFEVEHSDLDVTRQLVLMLELPGTPVVDGSGWVWPAAAAVAWVDVTPEQHEELRRLGYTDADLEDFAASGAYVGYRVFISEDGTDWQAFVAGD